MLVVLFWVFITAVLLGVLALGHFFVGMKLLPYFLKYELEKHGEKTCYDCSSTNFGLGSADFYRQISIMGRDKWNKMSKEDRDEIRETYIISDEEDGVREYEYSLEHCKRRAGKKSSAWLKHLPKVMKDQALGSALDSIGEEKVRLREIDLAVERYRAEELTPAEAWDMLFEKAQITGKE